jgi:hypothetical protein
MSRFAPRVRVGRVKEAIISRLSKALGGTQNRQEHPVGLLERWDYVIQKEPCGI